MRLRRWKANRIILITIISMMISGCSIGSGEMGAVWQNDTVTKNLMTMDTLMSLSATGRDADKVLEESTAAIERVNNLFDAENPESELSILNDKTRRSDDGVADTEGLSDETLTLLSESIQIMDMTSGAYNPLIRPLMELWGFTDNELYIPSDDEIQNALDKCKADYLKESDSKIVLMNGVQIDFGAIAKGYVSDIIMNICSENNIKGACMSLGGNIVCYGHKPDGSDYNVAIDYPDNTAANNKIIGAIRLSNEIISTSSGAQRYLEDRKTGDRYVHIINPFTGRPAKSDIKSVSIISDKGYLADGLSTACYVMGLDESINLWQNNSDDYDMIILTENDEIYVTESIAGRFTEYTGMTKPIVINKQ